MVYVGRYIDYGQFLFMSEQALPSTLRRLSSSSVGNVEHKVIGWSLVFTYSLSHCTLMYNIKTVLHILHTTIPCGA